MTLPATFIQPERDGGFQFCSEWRVVHVVRRGPCHGEQRQTTMRGEYDSLARTPQHDRQAPKANAMDLSEAERPTMLEAESARLKRLLAPNLVFHL